MKIKKLPITETTIDQSSEEDSQKMDQLFISMFISNNKYTINKIYDRYVYHNYILEDLKKEIMNKCSPLSRKQRDFLIMFKDDFILKVLNQIKEQYERKT